jgi:hypothetical protein
MTGRDTASEDTVPVGMYTETLARLYMRQGHVDKALRIYRHLAARQPSDLDLQDQIHALEHQLTTAAEMETETAVQALPIPVDWPLEQEEANPPVPLPVVQSSRDVEHTRLVIAQLERWLQVLRHRRP